MPVPRTAHEIRVALGPVYFRLKQKYDIKSAERRKRLQVARRELPYRCAACGCTCGAILELAHISPLAECARTTQENLLWLCTKPRDKEPDCHKLFDRGFCSIEQMRVWRVDWIEGKPPVGRESMLGNWSPKVRMAQQRGGIASELRLELKKQLDASQPYETWCKTQIRIAELTRRRTTRDSLSKARREINKVDVSKLKDARLINRYFYESGYIYLLEGSLERAYADFKAGRDILDSVATIQGNRWRWAAHTALMSQVSRRISANGTRSEDIESWKSVQSEFGRALKYSKDEYDGLRVKPKATRDDEIKNDIRHSGRWVQNCYLHLLKSEIALGMKKQAKERLKDSIDNWEKMDLSTGWDVGFRPTQLHLSARVLLRFDKSEDGVDTELALLVRILVLVLGARTQQPEGIKDVLLLLAEAMERRADADHRRVKKVAERCVDFSSWFHPSH